MHIYYIYNVQYDVYKGIFHVDNIMVTDWPIDADLSLK